MIRKQIPFGTISIPESSIERINKSLSEKRVSGGRYVHEFEEKFAKYVGVKYAIFTNSGTAALKMAYKYFYKELGHSNFAVPRNTKPMPTAKMAKSRNA